MYCIEQYVAYHTVRRTQMYYTVQPLKLTFTIFTSLENPATARTKPCQSGPKPLWSLQFQLHALVLDVHSHYNQMDQ